MKALIRGKETIAEDMPFEFIDWETGMPLTGPNWAGGPYTLVQNYVPAMDETEATYTEVVAEVVSETVTEDNTVVIDGVVYQRV